MSVGRAGLLHLALASLVLSSVPQFSHGEEKTSGNVGCLFSDRVCDDEEICFNDLVFGRCISTSSEQEDLTRFPWLSSSELGLLEVEMSRVFGSGYTWPTPYAQCIFQTILHCIANSHEYSAETCQHLREAQLEQEGEKTRDNDLGLDGFQGNNVYPGSPSNTPHNTRMYKFIPEVEEEDSFNAPSLPISYEDPYPLSNYPSLNYLQDDRDPNYPPIPLESSPNYLPSPLEDSPNYPSTPLESSPDFPVFSRDTRSSLTDPSLDYLDNPPSFQFSSPVFVDDSAPPQNLYEDDSSSKLFVPELRNYAGSPLQQFWDDVDIIRQNPELVDKIRKNPQLLDQISQNPQLEYVDAPSFLGNVPENFDDLILPNDDHEQTDDQDEPTDDEDDINEETEPMYADDEVPAENEPTFRERRNDEEALAPEPATLMDAIYHDEISARKQAPDYDFEYDGEENDEGSPLYYNLENDPIPIETVFSRNERLDVKKPGPFFKNSQNNFFLNKLIDGNQEDNETADNTGDYADNMAINDGLTGQTEYEMPLSPPGSRHKKDIFNEQPVGVFNSEPQDAKYYLFINIKDRFNTLSQGKKMIDLIADYLQIPHQAFSEPILENSKLAVEVFSNPRQLNATAMAEMLTGAKELKDLIKKRTNVDVDTITAGDENSSVGVVRAPTDSRSLVMLVFLLAAAITSLLLIAAILLILRKRKRKDITASVNDVITEIAVAKEEPVAEYKQLCRDWSRSSRASAGSQGGKEGKESNGKEGREGKEEKENPAAGTAARPVSSPSRAKLPNKTRESSEGSRTSSTSSWNEEPGVSSMDISTGHMVLAYMEDHLKNKQRLEQEWVGLCAYEAEPSATSIAFKVENKKKNRYPDKLPYDHNRVMLNPLTNGTSSDYINASTVMDHDPRNPAYIVTQGPLAHTVADFWQMVWEQGSVVIVMLTKLQENGCNLSHRYWPEEGSEQYHIFEVHLVSEHVWCDDYLVRSVYLRNTQTGETRTVTQFHFLSWPDTGVPTSTKAILEFRRKVNKSYRGRSCPIIIHCSDGVGRSGTYVLIDMVLNRMTKGSKEIDIAATLEHIRDQRSGMVQSRSQFEFCLMAVAEETHAILKALPQ